MTSISASALSALLKHCEPRSYPAKSVIFAAGDPSDTLYYICSGRAVVSSKGPHGGEIVLAYLGAGDFLGEAGAFLRTEQRQCCACARQACELAAISYVRLCQLGAQELAGEYSEILFALAAQMAARLRNASTKISELAFLDVSARIMSVLNTLSQTSDAAPHPQGQQLCITQQEIGRIAGCSREVAGRTLKHLQTENLIRIESRKIIVLDQEKIADLTGVAGLVFSLV